jgi:hypothetical protein
MDEEQDELVQEESGEPEPQTAEQDLSTELPEEPEALKAHAAELTAKLKEQTRETKKAQREAERQAEQATEQKTKADWLARQWEKQTAAPATEQPTAKASPGNVQDALKGMDLAEYVAQDNGVAKLVGDLEERGIIVTAANLNKILDARVQEENRKTSQATTQYRATVKLYPELEDPESELAVEAAKEFEALIEEKPSLDDPTRFEIAAARAARKIGYVAPAPASKTNGAQQRNGANNDRLRTAQGGPANRGGGASNRPAVITPELRKLGTKTFGGPVPEEVLKRVAARVQAQNQNRRT